MIDDKASQMDALYNKSHLIKGLACENQTGTMKSNNPTTGISPSVLLQSAAAEMRVEAQSSVLFAEKCPFLTTSAIATLFTKPTYKEQVQIKLN